MRIHKLSSTDAFIAFDLDDAPATGITRLARKVLVDGATTLARSTTYAFASFEVKMGGGSAGINAEGEAKPGAIEAFVGEVTELVSAGTWATDPGLGLSEDDFAPLHEVDPRPAALWKEGLAADLAALGAVAVADEFVSVSGAKVVVDGATDQLVEAVSAAGGEIIGQTTSDNRSDVLATECDIVFAGGKTGSIGHDDASTMQTRAVVPFSPVPVTAKALAVLSRANTVVVPDFVSTAAPLLAGFDLDAGDPIERVRALASELSPAGVGAWMASIERAEAFLSSWQEALPFGRPLA
jgi:glutamate dehydrogenase/leucine dehydrogenase